MKIADHFKNRPVETKIKVRHSAGGGSVTADTVLNEEHSMSLYGGGKLLHSFVCSPSDLAELCAGWLLSEGLRADAVEISADGLTAEAFGICAADGGRVNKAPNTAISASAEEMLGLFDLASDGYARSHGVHECVIKGEGWHIIRTDIGRHNAIDKAVGAAFLSGRELEGSVMFTSGRINEQTVRKAARCGTGTLMSKAVITRSALELCGKLGLKVLFSVKHGGFMTPNNN